MSDAVIANVFRFIGLFLVQVLILKNIDINTSYVNLYIYPMLILMLPIRINKLFLLFIAFFLGILVDLFYMTPGVHAAASVFIAFIRPTLCFLMEPRGGYDQNHSPNKHSFGMSWFMQYTGILMFIHLFVVFVLEAFTFSDIVDIMIRLVFSYILSMLLITTYQYIFNPKV